MQIVRNKRIVIVALLTLITMTACQKWVDDTSQPLEVDDSKIFSTEKGFRESLNGIYLQMGAESLYGKDLTMGLLSLAGRNYDSVRVEKAGVLNYNAAILNFKDASVKNYAADVWRKMYAAIINVNNLLHNIETKKTIFTGNNYNLFKGEALALRAYLHFDLLRLFASIDQSAVGVPYLVEVDYNPIEAGTVDHTLGQCLADLTAADALLDPEDLTTSHITKWAVKGLLARVYLYKGDLIKANVNAQEVINSQKFSLSTNNLDLLFTKESLFKLNIYNGNFYSYVKAIFSAPSLIGLSTLQQSKLYGSTNTDYRKSFVDVNTGLSSGFAFLPKKFTATASNIFPMVRLTEMYYIAAECASEVIVGLSYINQVRTARNINPLTIQEVPTFERLSDEIMSEYQKEFIGEGQVFFYFKRNNKPFETLPFYPKVPAGTGEAYLPIVSDASYSLVRPE